MPSKFKIFFAFLLVTTTFSFSGFSQDIASAESKTIPASTPSSADVIRQRVTKAKAYIAVRNYSAAIYELENIKRETSDSTLDSVINVLLMNSYLEQNDYKRAEAFLTKFSQEQKAGSSTAKQNYFAVAAQIIRGAKNQLERYHALGLNVADRNLPTEAAVDIQNMRTILELVVEQSKEMGKNPQNIDTAMALLEGATNARSSLAKDDYDANRWRTEVTDAREMLADSMSKVIDVTNAPAAKDENKVTANTQKPDPILMAQKTDNTKTSLKPVANQDSPVVNKTNKSAQTNNSKSSEETSTKKEEEEQKPEPNVAKKEDSETPAKRNRKVIGSAPKAEQTQAENKTETETKSVDNSPMEVGSLTQYATQRTNPVYPPLARNMRMTGVVKVEVIIDEDGKVVEVQNTNGPPLLQRAAKDAIVKWKFTPFERDGLPVKAIGFVSFNFSL